MSESNFEKKASLEFLATKQERRQKKEERRAKQRIENLTRAAKMHTFRLENQKTNTPLKIVAADR